MTVFVFELQEVIATGFKDRIGLGFVIIKCIPCDGSYFEIGFAVQFQRYGLFTFAFVFVSFRDFGSETNRNWRSGFMVTQAQA